MPAVTLVNPSNNQDIDGELSGIRWSSGNLTYSFPTSSSFYHYSAENTEPQHAFSAITNTAQNAVRTIVTWFSSVSNLTFSEITESNINHATVRFAKSSEPDTAWGYYPDSSPTGEGGDTWFSSAGTYDNPTVGSYAWISYAHELGHAVGLKHGHETGNDFGPTFPVLPTDHDSAEYSIMTYRSYVGSPGDAYTIGSGSGPQTLMQDDIAAIQYMYGANFSYNNGNSTYTWSPTTGQMFINGVGGLTSTQNRIFITVWDGGGNDTYDFSNYGTNLTVDLNPGAWTTVSTAQLARLNGNSNFARGNIANALQYQGNPASLIENAIGGTGDDSITGNSANNTLTGGIGNDSLNGGIGNDTASYFGASSGVTVSLLIAAAQSVGGGQGSDTLTSTENLTGSDFADTLTGDTTANVLTGGLGDDLLEGRTGDDSLIGGSGADTASFANASGSLTISLLVASPQSVGGGEGTDTLSSIEKLIGGAFADILTGNTDPNELQGAGGDDILAGRAGDDILNGGANFDTVTYANATGGVSVHLDAPGGQAVGGSEGTDTLLSIEALIGSSFADTLGGTTAGDTIGGGGGDDTLIGLAGNDILDGGSGSDTASYANATSGVAVDLNLLGSQAIGGGQGSDTLTSIEGILGSDFADALTGNASDNFFDGGSGDDTMIGGGGNDSLAGNSGIDTVDYSAASGNLTVNLASGAAQAVGGGQGTDTLSSVERLVGGAFDDALSGNSSANELLGGAGNDTLAGAGGNDTLDGGGDFDIASYAGASGGVSVDLSNTGNQSVGADQGSDTLISIEGLRGSAFGDVFTGTTGNDTFFGGNGDDQFAGGAGADTMDGEGGSDAADYSGANGSVTVNLALSGPQSIGANQGSDTLISIEQVTGASYADTLIGDGGDNLLDGRGGDDLLEGGAGNDQLIGADGIDTVTYANAAGGVGVNLGVGGFQAVGGGQGSDSFSSIDNLIGSAFNDSLIGDSSTNILSGGGGMDTLQGSAGSDVVRGEGGNDLLFGGSGADDIFGGDGDDNLYVVGNDNMLDGGLGYDQVIVLDVAGVNITVGPNNEYVAGNSGNDTLSAAGTTTAIVIGGAGGNDVLIGGAGNDTLAGMDDTDEVHGGLGADLLFAGTGSDNFFGDEGDDKLYILGNDGTIEGGDGFDQAIVLDTAGVSIVIGVGTEYGAGNTGNDALDGSLLSTALTLGGAGGDDTVKGGSNADILSGSSGTDFVYGYAGNDTIFGGDDNDSLFGGTGDDQLLGGNGADALFIEDASGTDFVSGFNDGLDTFNFSLHSTVLSLSDLSIADAGSDATITFNGGQLVVFGAAGLIDSSDFVFA